MRVKTAIVGCGNIAKAYAKHLRSYAEVDLVGFADVDRGRAEAAAVENGVTAYPSLDAVLSDPDVQLVVNLTTHKAHEEVIAKCIDAGKHVHTEKPMALSAAAARRLCDAAAARGVRLSAAPVTWMGEAQQVAAGVLRRGEIGRVRQVYAEVNHGRIEAWHPSPHSFYEVGVLWDVCIYPIALLTAFLGPVGSVQSMQRTLLPERVTLSGEAFQIAKPDFVVSMLDFACGATARVTGTFYSDASRQGASIEFFGDAGSLSISSAYFFNAKVEQAVYGQPFKPLSVPAEAPSEIEFGRGVRELARAILSDRPHPSTPDHASHVIEILECIDRSAAAGGTAVRVHSTFELPLPRVGA